MDINNMKKASNLVLNIVATISFGFLLNNTAWSSEDSNKNSHDIFMITTTDRSISEVVSAVKLFTKQQKWIYLGDFKVKKGQVILVKFCIKAAGKKAWKAGLKVSAMLPCGNMGIYKNNGKTEISILNPHYMNILYPDSNLKAAGDLLLPQYQEMLTAISK